MLSKGVQNSVNNDKLDNYVIISELYLRKSDKIDN